MAVCAILRDHRDVSIAHIISSFCRVASTDSLTRPLPRPYNLTDFEANFNGRDRVTDVLLPKLEALTPDGGAYLNEGDPQQDDFQDVFYGDNYNLLAAIKLKYDPFSLFYGNTAVGSDHWEQRDDGRLCRTW
jgi:hypothetical protein